MNELEMYQQAFDAYGEGPEGLHWGDYQSMAVRFRNLVVGLDIKGRSILDAGCGMGDLLPYLHAKTDDFSYLGMDINSDYINVAKKRYKGHNFEHGDPFNGKLQRHFDLVIASGVMNTNIKDWQKQRRKMIKNAFELTNEVLAFNMAGQIGRPRALWKIAYADASEVLDFCSKMTRKIVFKTHYLPDDFTIVMYK